VWDLRVPDLELGLRLQEGEVLARPCR
jgi:hypothetical protein